MITGLCVGPWSNRSVPDACWNCRLGTGWSMHTSETGSAMRSSQLTFEEQEHIMRVIRQAEMLEHNEMERIGYDTSSHPFSLLAASRSLLVTRGVDPYGTGGTRPPNIWTGWDIIMNVPLNISRVISATFYPCNIFLIT